MSVIYKIRNEAAMLETDDQKVNYLVSVGQEINRMISIIQSKNSTSFVEVIKEESQEDEPVCNQD